MTGAALTISQVTKRFAAGAGGWIEVLTGVDLEVHPGTALALVGRNGAGKSTLLRCAAGISAPTSGRIGRPARTVTVIELAAGLEPDLTGRENLELGLALHGLDASARRRVRGDVIDFAGIGPAIDAPMKHCSSGMRARLALAMALHADADLLLIDEVLAVGDHRFQREAIGLATSLVERGAALVLVTHDPYLALAACSEAAWLDGGRIAEHGPVHEVVTGYAKSEGAARRPAAVRHTRVRELVVSPATVAPDVEVVVAATIDRDDGAPPTTAVVELLPPVGAEKWWMRGADQSPAQRTINVVASTEALALGSLPPGGSRVEVRFDRLPITPPRAEIALTLFDEDGAVVDEATVTFDVLGPDLETPLLLEVEVEELPPPGR